VSTPFAVQHSTHTYISPLHLIQDFDWNELQKIPVAHGKTEHDVLSHETQIELNKIFKICVTTGITLSIVLLIAWPILALPAQVFGQVSKFALYSFGCCQLGGILYARHAIACLDASPHQSLMIHQQSLLLICCFSPYIEL